MIEKYEENVDYSFDTQTEDDSGFINIKLLGGEFDGIVYRYGKVSVQEEEEQEQAYLTFEFDVVDHNGRESLEENMEFKNHIGNILQHIMMKSVANNQNS